MTRLQRFGLALLLAEIVILQLVFVEVIGHFTPLHLPLASLILFVGGLLLGVVALVVEE